MVSTSPLREAASRRMVSGCHFAVEHSPQPPTPSEQAHDQRITLANPNIEAPDLSKLITVCIAFLSYLTQLAVPVRRLTSLSKKAVG
jgi:hypothetical protein